MQILAGLNERFTTLGDSLEIGITGIRVNPGGEILISILEINVTETLRRFWKFKHQPNLDNSLMAACLILPRFHG